MKINQVKYQGVIGTLAIILLAFSGYSQIISHDFNSSANGWTTSDNWIRNSSSFSGNTSNHWHCNPYNNYSSNQSEYVTSGTIDLSGYESMTVSIDIAYKTNNNDGFRLEYNSGSGWTVLGTNADANWYTDGDVNSLGGTNDGWGDNRQTSPHWSAFTHTLPASCDDNSSVQFRFYFATNGSSNDDGVAFDDFVITGSAITVLGKDGPGGVGDNTSNELWLSAEGNTYTDAGTTSAANNSSVQQWNDVSGNSNHAIETTGSEKPTLKTNVINGLSALDFDGNTERIASLGLSTSDNATVFAVFSRDGSGGGANDGVVHAAPSGNVFSTSGSSKSIGMWVQTSDNVVWGRGVQSNTSSVNISKVTALSLNTYYIVSQNYDGSNITQNVNSSSAGTVSYNGTLQSWTDFGIGRQGNESLNGQIAEVIAYKTDLNSAQRIIVENYLAAKYNLSLTSNVHYDEDDSGYDYEVAGIGAAADGSHEDAQGTGIVRIQSPSGMTSGEYLIWGHDNGALNSWGVTDLPATIQSRLARDWSASETGEVGTVTISFDLSNVAGSITASDLRLLVDGDGVYATGATLHTGATHLGSNIYQWTGIDIDDNIHFTIGSINVSQTPLPVELVEFKATPNEEEKVVDLFWVTSSEINNDYFTVEKTKDLENFDEVVQTVGQGTTNERTEYQEVDYKPSEGISYYRLSQTDFDGKTTYFNLEKVLLDFSKNKEYVDIELYPNPNSGHTMYMKIPNSGEEELNVLVSDFVGKSYLVDFTVIREGEFSVVVIEMNQKLAPGAYMINVNVGGQNHSHKLIVN